MCCYKQVYLLKNDKINESWFCVTPLWQQAFDWFRDEKGLISNLVYSYGNQFSYEIHNKYSYRLLSGVGIVGVDSYSERWFNSQEEARQTCLEKLIELVTENQNNE